MPDAAAHAESLVANIQWEWLMSFTIPTDQRVFGEHETVIYAARETAWHEHHVTFQDARAARRGYHRVLSLDARNVKTARRIVSHSSWENATP